SPLTAIPESVIVDPGSSLPLNTVGPLKVGASSTPLAGTVSVSDPVVAGPLAPSCEVTLRVRTAVSPPASGAVIRSAPRSLAANVAVPLVAASAVAPSYSVQPRRIPGSALFPYATLFRSSPLTAIPESVIVDPGSSLPLNTVGP